MPLFAGVSPNAPDIDVSTAFSRRVKVVSPIKSTIFSAENTVAPPISRTSRTLVRSPTDSKEAILLLSTQTLRVVRLFDPRGQRWPDHFSLSGPIIDPLTVIGEITTRLLRLNTADRVIERQVLQSLGLYPEAWQEST